MKDAPLDATMELSRYFGRREDQEKKQGLDTQSLCSAMNWQTGNENGHHMTMRFVIKERVLIFSLLKSLSSFTDQIESLHH